MDEMEMTVAYHCAPALAGIKPSNLVSFCGGKHPDLDARIAAWNAHLNPSGIYFEKICKCKKRILVLVYRREKMEALLAGKEVAAELEKAGYPVGEGLGAVIGYLKERISGGGGFPHEVGLFLGYPLEDVHGFVRSGGRDYKLNGYWKVYSDEQKARELFRRYTKCRKAVCARLGMGISISRLFAAA